MYQDMLFDLTVLKLLLQHFVVSQNLGVGKHLEKDGIETSADFLFGLALRRWLSFWWLLWQPPCAPGMTT